MNRIAARFETARREGKALLVSYLCAGDPDYNQSLACVDTLIEKGAGILELGVPFSDPLADGRTNQLAAERALRNGMSVRKLFQMVSNLRERTETPIVLYCYVNMVMAPGVESFVGDAKAAGVDAILILDLPPEEADEIKEVCDRAGMGMVFIVAPTTPAERVKAIAQRATSFIYYVSREGVTGVREDMASGVEEAVGEIRRHTDLPVVVGFGISTGEQARAIAQHADGVVVGSALVNCIAAHLDEPETMLDKLGEVTESLVQALDCR